MIHYLIEQLTMIAVALVETFHYWGIFIGMVIESACIPLPSEAIMLFGGFFVSLGMLNFWGVVAAGVLGNVVGSVLTYWVGANGGRAFLIKYGKYFLFNAGHLEKADRWFERYGEWAVFFGRNLPVIRTFISLPAGVSRMNFTRFFIYTFVGCIPWNIGLTYVGLKLGQNWKLFEPYLRPLSYAILFAIIAGVLWFFFMNMKKRFGQVNSR